MIKCYHYIFVISDIDETKKKTEKQINKIDKVQVDIEMMHAQTTMQILVSLYLVTFHNGHPNIIGLILPLSIYINSCVCVWV